MAKYLVIVESPAKAKTIKKFLGKSYHVEASNGHVRDLPKSQMGIDIEHDFEPKYITIRGKGELLSKLRKEVKKADKIFLATDPDREGEAISWHLLFALKLEGKKVSRITFNEITKTAVKNSIKQAREIDMDLVDAQQARRLLDRIVGYNISPLLWKKIKKGLSAGRVQSVALKLICDREEEVRSFIPQEYWTIEGEFKSKSRHKIQAKLTTKNDKKLEITSKQEADKVLKDLESEEFLINDVKKGKRTKKSNNPFTTSTLQQEASKEINFTPQKTMRIAQQLYEGVDIKGSGTVGLITYLRTDSTRISEDAHGECLDFIKETYGEDYVQETKKEVKKSKNAQDAHEAIRPTYVTYKPIEIKASLSNDQYKLYKLIWQRFVASRMAPAEYETCSMKIKAGAYGLTASASKIVFQGFMAVLDKKEKGADFAKLEGLKEGDLVKNVGIEGIQHFTQPPARYTEASLVKILEENGVGRPSTYAPTIGVILARNYVTKEKKTLYATELGEVVNDIMENYFSEIVDTSFTAHFEEQLDLVEEGKIEWKQVLRDFYKGFEDYLKEAEEKIGKIEIKDEETDIPCEKCGRKMVIKYGRYGKFLACPGFPECHNAKPYFEETDVICPDCGGKVLIKKTKKGRTYYGCENNPECEFMTWDRPINEKCPVCDAILLEKGKKNKKIVCSNKECDFVKVEETSDSEK